MAEPVPLADQIGALCKVLDDRTAANRGKVARMQMTATEAAIEALCLDAALRTLRYVQKHEAEIKALA